MWQLTLLLITQVFLGAAVLILLHKVGQMKTQVDEITKEVTDYISFIIEDEGKQKSEDSPERMSQKEQIIRAEEGQSSLIQSVLGEFFP